MALLMLLCLTFEHFFPKLCLSYCYRVSTNETIPVVLLPSFCSCVETNLVSKTFIYGFQLEEELVRILKCEKKLTKITGVEVLLKAWKCQCEKLKKFLAEGFSLAKDEATGTSILFSIATFRITLLMTWFPVHDYQHILYNV